MRRAGRSTGDDPRERSGGLRLESGEPEEDAPVVGAERRPCPLAGGQQQVRRASCRDAVPASYARYTARTAGVARAWLSLSLSLSLSNGP